MKPELGSALILTKLARTQSRTQFKLRKETKPEPKQHLGLHKAESLKSAFNPSLVMTMPS